MNKQISPDQHSLLAEYLRYYMRLRSDLNYPGNLAMLNDFENVNDWSSSDAFFERYGVGNKVTGEDQPFERAKAYELLLYVLRDYNSDQYFRIHKGTPFYFLAWTTYQFADFEKALFYMDAAVSEDLRLQNKKKEFRTPAISFFLLEQMPQAAGFLTLHVSLNIVITDILRHFSQDSGLSIKTEKFVSEFVKPILYSDGKNRSVLTALYGFLLEHELYKRQVLLRSIDGGSIEPFIDHLFKGARILESLLKMKGKGNNLEKLIVSLPELEVKASHLKGNKKSLISAMNLYNKLKSEMERFQNYTFAASYIIRNTTGHSLLWPDEFKSVSFYSTLYKCLTDAIFWSISKLWIEKQE